MNKFLLMLVLCMMAVVQSCSSDQEPMFPDTHLPDTELSHMIIQFEGKIYETDVLTIGDSVKYLNEEYDEIYRSKISKMKDIATLMREDEEGRSVVEYFSNEKNLLEKYTFIAPYSSQLDSREISTRSKEINMWPANKTCHHILAVAELYDDRNFSDTKLISYATDQWATTIPKLKDLGFNDKTSSIKVENRMSVSTTYNLYVGPESYITDKHTYSGSHLRPVLKSYKDSNYSGAVLYCIGAPTGSSSIHRDYNLKNIGWNDKISAIAWMIVVDFIDNDPSIPPHAGC
ncbi:MAG: hypothetical protein K2G23_06310 [Muribaculaceae bacterium]|nr:hypothetical protein [Muribaculaceae bacterium]